MSATLDAAAFARYFGGTKIVYIQVRLLAHGSFTTSYASLRLKFQQACFVGTVQDMNELMHDVCTTVPCLVIAAASRGGSA